VFDDFLKIMYHVSNFEKLRKKQVIDHRSTQCNPIKLKGKPKLTLMVSMEFKIEQYTTETQENA
jgi:hypothetical protein